MSNYPIAILSFNRVDYLRQVLESLAPQVASRRVYLFQDGGGGDVEEENIQLLQELIPSAKAMPAPVNLGIAMNFDRAERFVFETLGAEAGIFFEDDLVLGPHYLSMIEQLIGFALSDERIGYVGAYGYHRATLKQQSPHRTALKELSHKWGFGLTRRQWMRQKPLVSQYLDIVRGVPYSKRDHNRIIDLFHSWGLGAPGTSQDICKSHACILTGVANVSTYACFGHYIGRQGVHFNDAIYDNMGFGSTELFPEHVALAPPNSDQIAAWIERAKLSAMVESVQKKP